MLLCARGHCAANTAKPGLQQVAPHCVPRVALTLLQIIAMPCLRTLATIVLSYFTRSCSAAGFVYGYSYLLVIYKIKAGKGTSEKRATRKSLRAEAFF